MATVQEIINIKLIGDQEALTSASEIRIALDNVSRSTSLLKQKFEELKKNGSPREELDKVTKELVKNDAMAKELRKSYNLAEKEVRTLKGSMAGLAAETAQMANRAREFRVGIDGTASDLQNLQRRIAANKDELRKFEIEMGNNQANVGNYSESIKGAFVGLAGAFGIGLGIEQAISFGKESIKAFAEAEHGMHKLHTQIVTINQDGEEAYQGLIDQAKKLSDDSVYDDDDIIAVQTYFAQYGLGAKDIEKIMPVIVDFAAATGLSLEEAAGKVISGTEGMGRALKDYKIHTDSSKGGSERLGEIITQLDKKFKGFAAEGLTTTSGKLEKLSVQWGNLQEDFGGFIVDMTDGIDRLLQPVKKNVRATFFTLIGDDEQAKKELAGNTDKMVKTEEKAFDKKELTFRKGTEKIKKVRTEAQIKAEQEEKQHNEALLKLQDDLVLRKIENDVNERNKLIASEEVRYNKRLAELSKFIAKDAKEQALHNQLIEAEKVKHEKILLKIETDSQEKQSKEQEDQRKKDQDKLIKDFMEKMKLKASNQLIEINELKVLRERGKISEKEFDDRYFQLQQKDLADQMTALKQIIDRGTLTADASGTPLLETLQLTPEKKAELENQYQSLFNKLNEIESEHTVNSVKWSKERRDAAINAAGNLINSFAQLNDATLKNAKLAKGLAYADAVINTYKAANVALASAPPPINFIAMGAAIVAGLANVAQISKTDFRKKARGGIVEGASHDSGGVKYYSPYSNVELEGGELVVNKNIWSRPDYVSTISAMNADTGGVKFAAGGVVPSFSAPSFSSTSSLSLDYDKLSEVLASKINGVKLVTAYDSQDLAKKITPTVSDQQRMRNQARGNATW